MPKSHAIPSYSRLRQGRPRHGGVSLLFPLLGGLVLFCTMRQSFTPRPISAVRGTAGQQNFLSKNAQRQSEAILREDSPISRVLAPRSREPGWGLTIWSRDQFRYGVHTSNNVLLHSLGDTLASPIHALNCVWLA